MRSNILRRQAGIDRANIRAGRAFLAFCCVDHVQTVDLGDSALGAFWFASAALDAVIGNFLRHGQKSFLITLIELILLF